MKSALQKVYESLKSMTDEEFAHAMSYTSKNVDSKIDIVGYEIFDFSYPIKYNIDDLYSFNKQKINKAVLKEAELLELLLEKPKTLYKYEYAWQFNINMQELLAA